MCQLDWSLFLEWFNWQSDTLHWIIKRVVESFFLIFIKIMFVLLTLVPCLQLHGVMLTDIKCIPCQMCLKRIPWVYCDKIEKVQILVCLNEEIVRQKVMAVDMISIIHTKACLNFWTASFIQICVWVDDKFDIKMRNYADM